MKFDNNTPRVEFTIAKQVFTCPVVFSDGHVCTAGEAAALNQTLRENIRNNLAGTDDLTQGDVDGAVLAYEFGSTRAGGPKRTPEQIIFDDVLLAKAQRVAKEKGKPLPPAGGKNADPALRAKVLAAIYSAHKAEIDKEVTRRKRLAAETIDATIEVAGW